MKKFLVFIISFVILFTAFQILSGLILTAIYTPNFTQVANNLSGEFYLSGELSGSVSTPLLLALISAIVAYFLTQKIFRTSKIEPN